MLFRSVLKVDSLAHDVEILKIRTTPLEAKKTEPINSIQVQINDNIRMLAQICARREREEAEIAEKSAKKSLLKFVPSNPLKKLKLSVPMSVLMLLNMFMPKMGF